MLTTMANVNDDAEQQEEGDEPLPNDRWKHLWNVSINRVICGTLRDRKWSTNNPEIRSFLTWRYGWNLYRTEQYDLAMPQLNEACTGSTYGLALIESGMAKEYIHPNSDVHLTAARCAMKLYALNGAHEHLDVAYRHYSNAIQQLEIHISIARLPGVLHEFATMMEQYGSYDASLDLYRRVLTTFPYYKGYFEIMYRSAMVGKHLSNAMSTESSDRELVLTQCADNVGLILEAVPVSINEIHAMFLHARCLECLSDPKNAGRAGALLLP